LPRAVKSFTKKYIFEMPRMATPRLVEDVQFTFASKYFQVPEDTEGEEPWDVRVKTHVSKALINFIVKS
jgi:hypothetical protein